MRAKRAQPPHIFFDALLVGNLEGPLHTWPTSLYFTKLHSAQVIMSQLHEQRAPNYISETVAHSSFHSWKPLEYGINRPPMSPGHLMNNSLGAENESSSLLLQQGIVELNFIF